MTTLRTTWPAQIAVVLVLLASGTASGASGFLSGNSPLGENAAEGRIRQAAATLSSETHRGCGDLKPQDAADLFVASTSPLRGCFPADTPVTTQDGLRPIQSVRPDDHVWGFDLASCEWKLRRVVETYEHDYEGDLIALTVEGEVIEATSNHPFWVVEGEGLEQRERPDHVPETPPDAQTPGRWVDAGNLRAGDVLLLKSGRRVTISRLSVRHVRQKVYNFQVEEVHTYAVGRGQVLVHNKPVEFTPPAPRRIALGLGDDLQQFASARGADPYWNWTGGVTRRSTEGRAFGRAFTDAARHADEIHFNLNGINDLAEAYRLGRGGYRYEPTGLFGEFRIMNATNTELTTVIRDPALLNKTTFWRNGQRVDTSTVLREIGISAP